jgi:hypothetical protein
MNIYQQMDEIGRDKVINQLIKNHNVINAEKENNPIFSGMDRTDIQFTAKTGNVISAEVKDRWTYSDTYQEWMIEKNKYENIFIIASERNTIPAYINTFADGKMIIWDLSKLKDCDIRLDYISRPKTTMDRTKGNKKYPCYLIQASAGTIYNMK